MPDGLRGAHPIPAGQAGHQRASGRLRVVLRGGGGRTRLADLRQEGCLKARFPRAVDWTEVVTLNTSGGIAGGDSLGSAFSIGEAGRATIAGQAAERIYRALPGSAPARVATEIAVGAEAAVEWLPQETILFDRCALDRTLDVELASDSWFLGVEALVFGRAAMGESVTTARLRDSIRIRRDGALLLADTIRLHGPVAALLAHRAVANGGRAVATIVHVAPDAETRLDGLRHALAGEDAGASAWNGMLLARIVAADGASLRRAVVSGLQSLRAGRTLPRVWMC